MTIKQACIYFNSAKPHLIKDMTENRLWQYRIRYPDYFTKHHFKLYVKKDFIDQLLKRANVSDIYYDLIDKYGTDYNIAKELSKRAEITREASYLIVQNLCAYPRNITISKAYQELYKMLDN